MLPLAGHFASLRTNLELTQTVQGVISARHKAVRSYVEANIEGSSTLLIGSIQRETRINPRAGDRIDIDILLVLGKFYAWNPAQGGIMPDQALNIANEVLNDSKRYRQMNPSIEDPTVSMSFSDDIDVEIVAAYEDHIGFDASGFGFSPVGRGYWVAKDGKWTHADYVYDASMISATNKLSGQLLVPVIKMLKAIKRMHFTEMESFYLEGLAADWIPVIIKQYEVNGVTVTYPELLLAFFTWAKEGLHGTVQLPGSNTPAISIPSEVVADLQSKFDQIKAHILVLKGASKTEQIRGWRELFGESFPIYIK